MIENGAKLLECFDQTKPQSSTSSRLISLDGRWRHLILLRKHFEGLCQAAYTCAQDYHHSSTYLQRRPSHPRFKGFTCAIRNQSAMGAIPQNIFKKKLALISNQKVSYRQRFKANTKIDSPSIYKPVSQLKSCLSKRYC